MLIANCVFKDDAGAWGGQGDGETSAMDGGDTSVVQVRHLQLSCDVALERDVGGCEGGLGASERDDDARVRRGVMVLPDGPAG